jgi:predicted SAM-dependent methyltransferase
MAQRLVARFGWELRKSRGEYQSETSKCRDRLAPFCDGCGLDLGAGGDPINESAIRVDLPSPYARVGPYPVQLKGDATKLAWFADECLDYLYSSHLLEDYEDAKPVLKEWLRVLRPGGRLIIFCPDEQVYRRHCAETGQTYNPHHKVSNFSLATVKADLASLGQKKILHEAPLVDIYSWELVLEKA